MRNKRNNGGILREARNEFEAELTSDTLLCFLLTDSGMTTYEISPTIYSPVRKDLEWSLTCNKGPHFATPLPGWDRNASSTDVMGYQDRTRYDGRPHYIIHNPGKGISRSGTFADARAYKLYTQVHHTKYLNERTSSRRACKVQLLLWT